MFGPAWFTSGAVSVCGRGCWLDVGRLQILRAGGSEKFDFVPNKVG